MLVVANRIPVADCREDEFEDVFASRLQGMDFPSGLRRVELLCPVEADQYVIQAYWESQEAFEAWRTSDAFQTAHADLPDDLFTGPNRLDIYERKMEQEPQS